MPQSNGEVFCQTNAACEAGWPGNTPAWSAIPDLLHFQNDVHAAVARRLQNFFLISGFAVIEDLMRPLPLGHFEAFRRPCSAKNLQTYGARDLERRSSRFTFLTPSPTASTTPAPSDPGV